MAENKSMSQFLVLAHPNYWPIRVAYFSENEQDVLDKAEKLAKLISADAVPDSGGGQWFLKGSTIGSIAIVCVLEANADNLFGSTVTHLQAKGKTFGDLVGYPAKD